MGKPAARPDDVSVFGIGHPVVVSDVTMDRDPRVINNVMGAKGVVIDHGFGALVMVNLVCNDGERTSMWFGEYELDIDEPGLALFDEANYYREMHYGQG